MRAPSAFHALAAWRRGLQYCRSPQRLRCGGRDHSCWRCEYRRARPRRSWRQVGGVASLRSFQHSLFTMNFLCRVSQTKLCCPSHWLSWRKFFRSMRGTHECFAGAAHWGRRIWGRGETRKAGHGEWRENGRGVRTRTAGPRFWRPMLYQLSYTPAWAGRSYPTATASASQLPAERSANGLRRAGDRLATDKAAMR